MKLLKRKSEMKIEEQGKIMRITPQIRTQVETAVETQVKTPMKAPIKTQIKAQMEQVQQAERKKGDVFRDKNCVVRSGRYPAEHH